jgi:Protein of unknown function (DUF2798)
MTNKIAYRYRVYIFALVMSFFTSIIVSSTIIALRTGSYDLFLQIWPSSFAIAWPIVFVTILTVAPHVNQLINQFVETEPFNTKK